MVDVEVNEWNKVERDIKKAGYRDGVDKGRNDNLQPFFDMSYVFCKKIYTELGALKGKLVAHVICGELDETGTGFVALMDKLKTAEKEFSQYRLPPTEDLEKTLKQLELDWETKISNWNSEITKLCSSSKPTM